MGSNRTAEPVGILGTYIKSPNLCCISLEYGHIISYPLMMSDLRCFCTSSIIQKPFSEIPYRFKLGDCIPCGSGGPRKLEDGFRDFGVAGSGGSAVDSALVVVDRREDGVLTEFVETPGLQPPVGKPGNGARNLRFEGLEVNFEVGLQDDLAQ